MIGPLDRLLPVIPMSYMLLFAQAVLAIVAVRELGRHVFPAVGRVEHSRLITEVWGPLAIVLPLSIAALRVDGNVHGAGWLPLGGPVVCAWAGLATALVLRADAIDDVVPPRPALIAAALSGLVLLLLGAVHVMSIWVGQCAFALAAVLLWMNTPPLDPATAHDGGSGRAGFAMFVALLAAIGQGLIYWRIEDVSVPVSAGLLIGFAVTATCTAGAGGAAAALVTAAWASVYGMLLGLGFLGFPVITGALRRILSDRGAGPEVSAVAEGFGAYAAEAVWLILFAITLPVLTRLPGVLRRIVGAALIVALAIASGVRLAG